MSPLALVLVILAAVNMLALFLGWRYGRVRRRCERRVPPRWTHDWRWPR